MTNRFGSPWIDGEFLYGADLNDTVNALGVGIMQNKFVSGVGQTLAGFVRTSGLRVLANELGTGSVFASNDLGSSWYVTGSVIGSPTAASAGKNYFVVCRDDPNYVVRMLDLQNFLNVGEGSGVPYSVDGGSSWLRGKGIGISGLVDLKDMSYGSSGLLYGIGECSGTNTGLVYSTNFGSTWNFRTDSSGLMINIYRCAFNKEFGVVLTNGGDALVTFNGGSHFVAVAGDPSNLGFLHIYNGSVWYLVDDATNNGKFIYRGVGSSCALDMMFADKYQSDLITPLVFFPAGSLLAFGYQDFVTEDADSYANFAVTDGQQYNWVGFPTSYAVGSNSSMVNTRCFVNSAIGSNWILAPMVGNILGSGFVTRLNVGGLKGPYNF